MVARFFSSDRMRDRVRALKLPIFSRQISRTYLTEFSQNMVDWIRIERERRRFFPWLAPAMGAGVLFAFDQLGAGSTDYVIWAFLVGVFFLTFVKKLKPFASIFVIAGLAAMIGYFAVIFRIESVSAPIISATRIVPLSAIVEVVDPRPSGPRLLVRPFSMGEQNSDLPVRLRLTAKGETEIQAGDVIEVKALIMPPPPPSRPGGYDFAREAYFSRVGGSGSVLGALIVTPDVGFGSDALLDMTMTVDRWRNELAERIIGVIGGDAGAVAAALVTGKRGMISEETNEALRAAGIYHIVSISGLHMVLAAGMVFWLTRFLLVLVPSGRFVIPAKSVAAIAAMLGAAAYTVFAGAEVATIRSMIMTIVLFGSILAGRPAISIRNLAIAAILVILVEPETLLGPSFQMSFAAVAAMIAVYERLPPSLDRPAQFSTSQETASEPPKSTSGRIIGRFVRYAKILAITTLIAQAATGPFAAFHFQQFQTWGLIGNALTLPLVELIAMPIALGAVLALPFGADEIFWWAMGLSMEGMLGFAEMVASWPYAVQALPAIPVLSLLCLSSGLIWLTFWSTPLRWGGIGFVIAGLLFGLSNVRPDVIVSRDGRAIAVRGADGLLTIAGLGASDFVVRQWLLADGDLRKPDDPLVRRNGFCDPTGCVVRLASGQRVALALRTRALIEDCRKADLVVTPLAKPNNCRADAIDGIMLRQTGALELFADGEGYRIKASRPTGYDAPWAKNPLIKSPSADDADGANELNDGKPDPDAQEKPELE